ncbi:hypothetical protein LSH36_174g04014 [Paralvinella palmiformis]|uniref:Transposase Helix-turn-helix domain-containing protein n=1 Tax=Paralvinella palmiformis TaxID=53620 RepID=A0AAD9JRR7_9ANNE|nr:hypothetical protein LSH36_174g04014 [Paralvinella palmiformis]
MEGESDKNSSSTATATVTSNDSTSVITTTVKTNHQSCSPGSPHEDVDANPIELLHKRTTYQEIQLKIEKDRSEMQKKECDHIRGVLLYNNVQLRLGLLVRDLAQRFSISTTSVNRYFTAWINYMYLRLGSINIWPLKKYIISSMKEKYSNLEWIIDTFEMQIQRLASLLLQSQSYSSYKSRNTVKGKPNSDTLDLTVFIIGMYFSTFFLAASDKEVGSTMTTCSPRRKDQVWDIGLVVNLKVGLYHYLPFLALVGRHKDPTHLVVSLYTVTFYCQTWSLYVT